MSEDATHNQKAFAHKKSLGQNFLTSDIVPKWLTAAADLNPKETVLEIGPGTGMLTQELLRQGARVCALEADIRAVEYLQTHFATEVASGQLTIVHTDARLLSLEELGLETGRYSVVSNIPYYLSGFLLRQLLETPIQPRTLVFLMQKEVVHRITRDQKSSLLSLSVHAFGEPEYVKTVTRGHFNPSPKVDSAILAVRNISHERLAGLPPTFFFDLLHLGLGSKRKQLVGNLSQHYERKVIEGIFSELSIPKTARGEDLPLSLWVALGKALYRS
jgi:16S rRNA (adenine1518-N6/adenine1519-N6)-dimethyltransferase